MALARLTHADAGWPAGVCVGDTVELRLPENRAPGYRRSLRLPERVRLVADDDEGARMGATNIRSIRVTSGVRGGGDHPERGPGVSPAPGGGGVRRPACDSGGVGRHLITAELMRPWEDRPRHSATFTVAATPSE